MYLGFITGWVGLWIVFGQANLLAIVIAFAVVLGVALFVVLYEEPTLRRKFGAEYAAYCRHVPRWIPSRIGDPDADPTDPSTVTDPTSINSLAAEIAVLTAVDFAAQQAHDAITTPWGGVPVSSTFGNEVQLRPGGNPVPGGPEEPGTSLPGPPTPPEPVPPDTGAPSPHRAQIHAVTVSNLSDPSQALSGNVDLTGGIIALGPTGSLKPGRWDPNVRNHTRSGPVEWQQDTAAGPECD